jgi:hypothetical protein
MGTQQPNVKFTSTDVGFEDPLGPIAHVLKTNFYKPDLQAVRIVLGAIKAHYLRIGDPAWLFVVAPPGTGKTTISIMGASGLEEVTLLSDFTENTFLSGFYQQKEAGLLERLGKTVVTGKLYTTTGNGIFLAKDFTTVLSMHREKRAKILAQLREIHDGMFKRDFGTGETKVWKGRVSIVAAVTPVLDRHYSIFSTLGERFLQVRWHRPDSEEAGQWAIRQQGHEEEIQHECSAAIQVLFNTSLKHAPNLPDAAERRLAAIAELAALGRTHVFRSSWGGREVEDIPESEANTRIAKGLAAIARGIAALNQHREVSDSEIDDALRVAFDCIPDVRRKLLLAAIHDAEPGLTPMPRTVRDRALEELQGLGLLAQSSINADHWLLTELAHALLSSAEVTPLPTPSGICSQK